MKTIVTRSYAKINLALDVTKKRDDGFHELDMVMVPIELHDSIWLSELKKEGDNFVTVDDFSNGFIEHNTASESLKKFEDYYSLKNSFRIDIHKVIPMQAGLGGGSSNAAFTVMAVNKHLKVNAPNALLKDILLPLGCDIPFFVDCVPMRCQGLGEKMTPISIKNNYYVLIVKPKNGCSTASVYKKYDECHNIKHGDIDKVIEALETGNDDLLAESMFNVLETPAIAMVPEIQVIKDKLYEEGLKLVLMSGSGSSVFALSTDKRLLKNIAKKYEDIYRVIVTKVKKD